VVEELKPCPFCGGEASDAGRIRYSTPLPDTWWADGSPVTEAFYVNCIKCGASRRSGVVDGYQTQAEAVVAWNTRAPDATLQAQCERQRVALEAARNCLSAYVTDLLDDGYPNLASDVIVIRDGCDTALAAPASLDGKKA